MFLVGTIACQNKTKEVATDAVPQVATVEFTVQGMSCQGCVQTVQSSALQVAGVTTAKASLEDTNAIVEFTTGQTDTVAIRKAIELNGYKVIAVKTVN